MSAIKVVVSQGEKDYPISVNIQETDVQSIIHGIEDVDKQVNTFLTQVIAETGEATESESEVDEEED
jgi:hypothetical protein